MLNKGQLSCKVYDRQECLLPLEEMSEEENLFTIYFRAFQNVFNRQGPIMYSRLIIRFAN